MAVSLLLDDYEHALWDHHSSKASAHALLRKQLEYSKEAVPPKNLSLDDMDMLPLWTQFDDQMIVGSPMYLEFPGENGGQGLIAAHFTNHESHSSQPVPCDASNFHLEAFEGDENPFQKLADLRVKYILSSSQDAKSNIKYNVDKWFLYPQPLPKFWKYDHDERLKDEDSSEGESSDDCKKHRHHRNHYTGEFFELDQYKKEFRHHMIQYGSPMSQAMYDVPSFEEFQQDFTFAVKIAQNEQLARLSMRRLRYLNEKFELFQDLNAKAEKIENKLVPYRDFYNCRKVDCDFHLSGCISQRQLSEFIWEKLNSEPDRVVYETQEGRKLTLSQIFEVGRSEDEPVFIGLKVVDDQFLEWYKHVYLISLHVIPHSELLKLLEGETLRFYILAKTFLEFDNYIEGEYLAEIVIDHVITNLEKSKYQTVQASVDFQFHPSGELSWWERFAHWLVKWNVVSYNVRWNVQIKRVFTKLYHNGKVRNFQEFLDAIFQPILDKKSLENVELQYLLANLLNFDVVVSHTDDFLWRAFPNVFTKPKDWEAKGDNPTVMHYMYYTYAYLAQVNCMRYNNSLNTFSLRNSCSSLNNRTSQAGTTLNFNDQIESIVCNMLLCNGGLLQSEHLWNSQPTLSYLYYLFQIPVLATPLSSVSMISTAPQEELKRYRAAMGQKQVYSITQSKDKTYRGNPFLTMLKVGMKVSLSSNSVLFNKSYTLDPIIEEYSVAASIYLLEAADLCELARNSVICSGYEGFYKAHWAGLKVQKSPFEHEVIGCTETWYDTEENTSHRHNVPIIRRLFRKDSLDQEWEFILDQQS
ncbi:YBR284W and YJL070C [Zygosaccharomyces parabailii]|nr:YBR284W and YJL070C [Zygosaccharomyces parabailii]CDH12522.1 related to Putative AMP deaminases [Zygosaccharomyces bailii ISA1307]